MIISFKIFENTTDKLRDFHIYKGFIKPKKKELDFKYKIGDIVLFKPLNRHYIIKNINTNSDIQDYYIHNPLYYNNMDNGWVVEEEISDSDKNSENYNDLIFFLSTEKYNL